MGFKAENGAYITDAMLDEMAREYEGGTWSGHGEVRPGRPRIYDEEMQTVSFRLPKTRVAAIARAASERGVSKSEFFREAIELALKASA